MKEIFLKLFNLSWKKIKMLFAGLGRSVLGETVPEVLSYVDKVGSKKPLASKSCLVKN